MRITSSLGAAALVFGFGLATGCGSDSDSGSPKPGSSSPVTGCPAGSCDQAEVQAYGICITDACDAEYQTCYGPDYKTGKYSAGPCATYYTCLAKCSCGDNACLSGCGVAPSDCQLCIANKITYCVSKSTCTAPSCTSGPGELGTCADLAACCSSITDSTYKTLCDTELGGAQKQGGDILCDTFLKAFHALKACP
jgi:hypothetical protein